MKKYYDIYLWTYPDMDKLIKIGHLTYKEAVALTQKWFGLNDTYDYMFVCEGSTPWKDEPEITVKDKEWLETL